MVDEYTHLEKVLSRGWQRLSAKIGLNCYGTVMYHSPKHLHCTITLLGGKEKPSFSDGERIIMPDDAILLQTEVYSRTPTNTWTRILEERDFSDIMKVTYEYNKIVPEQISKLFRSEKSSLLLHESTPEILDAVFAFRRFLATNIRDFRNELKLYHTHEKYDFYDQINTKLAHKYKLQLPKEAKFNTFQLDVKTYGGKVISHSHHQELHLQVFERIKRKHVKSLKSSKKYWMKPFSSLRFYYLPESASWECDILHQQSAQQALGMETLQNLIIDYAKVFGYTLTRRNQHNSFK